MPVDERDITNIVTEVEATSWHLRETIRIGELAATHLLVQMRRLQMLEEQKIWKREVGFDYIETAAEMDARRSRSNLVPAYFFYRSMFNPKCPHTPYKFTLEMRVAVEGLRMEIILSQSESPLRNVMHRRDGYPRSVRGRRNPEHRDDRPRSVWGRINPEYRELSQRRGNKCFLFKPVWMFFCASIAQARSRTVFFFSQTSGWATRNINHLPHNKSLLARSSRDQRRSSSNKGRQHGLPINVSNLTPESTMKSLLF